MNYWLAAGVAMVGCGLFVVAMRNHGAHADDDDRTEAVRAAIRGGTARNVILFTGDGMGDSDITAARNYAVGPGGRRALDTLPLTGVYTTYSVEEMNPDLPDFVTDSAASGTA
jgi:alkaline phosphatase